MATSTTRKPGEFIEGTVEIKLNGAPRVSFRDLIFDAISIEAKPETELDVLRRERDAAMRNLRDYEDAFRRINDQPCSYVTVIGPGAAPGRWLVRRGSETLEVSVAHPTASQLEIVPGCTVRVLTQTMNILSVVDAPPTGGELAKVLAVIDAKSCEVTGLGGSPSTRVVLTANRSVKVGDRVVLDASGTVIVSNVGPEKLPLAGRAAHTGVSWDDIGGQAEAKAAMREAIEGPVLHRELYARYGRRPTKGVLLYGPPGNGKTMLGKAAASALAALHGGEAVASGFIYVKGPELLSMYVGAAEKNVRELFDSARRHKEEHGYPAVIFLDEAEALLGRRGALGIGAAISSTLVPMFLAEMDGMTDSGALVILATNRPDVLDPAIVREGRIDRKVLVGRPSREDAPEVFERHLRGRPIGDELDAELLAAIGIADLFDSKHALYVVTKEDGSTKTVTLGHVTSGAQIAAIADVAASKAIERELSGGATGGITQADITAAIEQTLREQRCVDHTDELVLFCEPFKQDVKSIERAAGPAGPGGSGGAVTSSLLTEAKPGSTHVVSLPKVVTVSRGGDA